tara:strand:- start:3155 stop:7777 length:4623 start_codon:yes stop_codon:yes gene_type:complete
MKGTCPTTREGVIKKLKDELIEYIANHGDDPLSALQVLRHRILSTPGSTIRDQELLNEAVAAAFPGKGLGASFIIEEDNLGLAEKRTFTAPLKPFQELFAVELDIDESTDQDQGGYTGDGNNSPSLRTGDGGPKVYDGLFFDLVGKILPDAELAKIYDKVRKMDFVQFWDWTEQNFGSTILDKDSVKEIREGGMINPDTDAEYTERELKDSLNNYRKLRAFWIVNQSVNKIKFSERIQLTYTNISRGKLASLIRESKGVLSLVKEKLGTALTANPVIKLFQNILPFNAGTKIDLPEWLTTNFIEGFKTKIRGIKVGGLTKYLTLSDLTEIIKLDGGGWFAKDILSDLSFSNLNQWAVSLMRQRSKTGLMPQVIVGMSAGDKGNIIVTEVLADQIKDLLTESELLAAFKSMKLPAWFMKEIASSKTSIYTKLDTMFRKITDKELSGLIKVDGKGGFVAKTEGVAITENTRELMNRAIVYIKALQAADVIAYNNFQKYIDTQTQDADIKADFNGSLKDIPKENGRRAYSGWQHMAGIIAKHEWWKAVRGNDYLENGTRHNFNRARLSVTKGLINPEARDSNHVIYDAENVDVYYNGKKIKNISKIPGLVKPKNWADGISFISTEFADETADGYGVFAVYENEHNLRDIKTVLVELSEDGNNYIEMKHSEQVGIAGLKIVKKGKNPDVIDNVIADVIKEGDQVKIFKVQDGRYVPVDMISDTDAVKTNTGEYDLEGRSSHSFSLPNTSRRLVIAPHARSAGSVFNATQYLNVLNYTSDTHQDVIDEFGRFFTDMLLDQSSEYINSLLDAVEDPNQMRKLIGYIFAEKGVQKDHIANKLTILDGIGINSPEFRALFESLLTNLIFNKGATQARTTDPRMMNSSKGQTGSHYVLKPDPDRIGLDENGVPEGVILSADNAAIYNKIVKVMKAKKMLPDGFDSLDKGQQIRQLNAQLKANPISIYDYRAPIVSINAVESRRILEFVEDEGNAIYHHPLDVYTRLVGDFDIDEAGVVLLTDKQAEAFKKFQNSVFFKEQRKKSSELDIFEMSKPSSLASFSGTLQDMSDTVKGHFTQGIMTNAKNLLFTLSTHFNSIEFTEKSGNVVTLTPKKPDDMSIMDYAPLEDKVERLDDKGNKVQVALTTDILHEMGWTWASIVVKDGKRYLQTTAEHEMLLIVNAAVDHPKLNILTTKWGYENPNWIYERIFNIEGGELTKDHIKLLKGHRVAGKRVPGLLDNFSFSKLKKGRDGVGNKMSISQIYYKLTNLQAFFDLSAEGQQESLKAGKEIVNTTTGDTSLKVSNISMNKVLTYEEELLLNPIKQLRKRVGEEGPQSPMEWSEELDNNAHLIAARDAATWAMKQGYGISSEVAIEAEAFAIDLMDKYWGIIKNLGGVYTQNSVNYDPDLLALTSAMEFELNKRVEKHGEGFSVAVTVSILNRVAILETEGEKDASAANIKQLPPLPVLHYYEKTDNLTEEERKVVDSGKNVYDGVYPQYKKRQEEIQYYKETNDKGESINKYDSKAVYDKLISNRPDVIAMLINKEGPCS